MKRFGALVAVLLCGCFAMGQTPNITIKGRAANADGKTIELYKYTDQMSHREVLLDNDEIDGSFELKMYANYTTQVFLQVENYSQTFYVEPGRTYDVYIPRFDWAIDEKKNVYLSPEALPVGFENLPKDEVNLLINEFDALVDSFITANRYYFDQKYHPQRQYFDTLVALVNKRCPDKSNEFYNRYKKYSLAELKFKLHFDSRRNMFKQYIDNQPILYYDENYMSLFLTMFANSTSGGNRYNSVYRMSRWINGGELNTYLDSLGLDPLLRNEQVRELVAIETLKECYYNKRYYNRDRVVHMLELLKGRTKFPEHRTLIANLLKMFSQNSKGGEVPTFTLPNVDKQMVSLDKFKGKWVYLSFVRVGDPHSLKEVMTLAHFRDSVYAKSKNIEFVTICCDREFQKMYHFLKNTKHCERYNWTWLHFNNNFKLLENFGVVSYPTFLLINPDGKLQYSVTPTPASGIFLSPPWQEQKQAEQKQFFLNNR